MPPKMYINLPPPHIIVGILKEISHLSTLSRDNIQHGLILEARQKSYTEKVEQKYGM